MLMNMLMMLTLEACFRMCREPEAGLKSCFCAKVPVLISEKTEFNVPSFLLVLLPLTILVSQG